MPRIERIFTRPPESPQQVEHDRVRLRAGAGVEGDRYFDCHEEPGQNLTLVEAEEIEAFLAAHGRVPGPQALAITGRNLVTRGVRLNALVGQEFWVGDVRLRGVELCEPCASLGARLADAALPAPAVVRHWLHKAGLRADVLSDGVIERGAPLSLPGQARLRQATRADIPAIWAVRYGVRENTLTPGVIGDEDVRREIEDTGRGWVIEEGPLGAERIVAFAIGNAQSGHVWALFVAPGFEGRGHGTRLHDAMLAWLWAQGLRELWLSTGPGTRAEGFYRRRGWQDMGCTPKGEIRFELRRETR